MLTGNAYGLVSTNDDNTVNLCTSYQNFCSFTLKNLNCSSSSMDITTCHTTGDNLMDFTPICNCTTPTTFDISDVTLHQAMKAINEEYLD